MPLRVRPATPDDCEQVRAIYEPYCHTPISFELEPPPASEMRRRLEKTLVHFPWLMCESDGETLGYAYAGAHRERAAYHWSVDTSVYVRAGRHRAGIGRTLYRALFEILPLQGYVNAYAGVTLPNPASVGLHTAMGFELVGVYRQVGYKCGVWHDVGWFQRPLQPQPVAPQPTKAWTEVAWEAALAGQRLRVGGFQLGNELL
jgi:phosphinothricin acetyltransferase